MSGRHWTPYQIEIMLHHYCSGGKFPRWTAPGYEGTVSELVVRGLLNPHATHTTAEDDSGIAVTDLGRCFVEMLLQTPLPRHIFVDPRTGKEVAEERMFRPGQFDSGNAWERYGQKADGTTEAVAETADGFPYS